MDSLLDAVALRLKADELEKSASDMLRKGKHSSELISRDFSEQVEFTVDRNDIIASHTLTCIDGFNRHGIRQSESNESKQPFAKRTKRISQPTFKAASAAIIPVATPSTSALRDPNHRPRRGRKGKSIYRGVSHTREGKYRAVLYVERKQIYLGVFNDEVSAARAHDKGVLAHGLGDAYLNFKDELYSITAPLNGQDVGGVVGYVGNHCEDTGRLHRRRSANCGNSNIEDRERKRLSIGSSEFCGDHSSDITETGSGPTSSSDNQNTVTK